MIIRFGKDKECPFDRNFFHLSTNDGMTFCQMAFYNPVGFFVEKDDPMAMGTLIDISFEKDVAIPGFEFRFCLLGLMFFFRTNFKESKEVFAKFDRDIAEMSKDCSKKDEG